MRFRSINSTLLLFAFLLVFGCTKDEESPLNPNQTVRLNRTAEEIPEVTSALLDQIGLRSGKSRFSVSTTGESQFKINWDKIKQLVDSTGKQTFTFGIEDTDNDPSTFYNLIFQLTREDEPYQPYILKYTMTKDFTKEYYNSGSLEGFQGTVQKILVNSNTKNSKTNEANNDDDELLIGDGCPGTTRIGFEGDTNTGGPSGGYYGGEIPGYDDDVYWQCEVFVTPTDWYICQDYPACNIWLYDETTYEYSVENCELNSQYTTPTDDDSCNPEDGNIPIIEPEVHEDKIDDSNLKPCMKNVMNEIKDLNSGMSWVIQRFASHGYNGFLDFFIPNYNWSLSNGSLPNGFNGLTLPRYDSQQKQVNTTIDDSKFTNASDLAIAKTLLHEAIHAHLVVWDYTNGGNISAQQKDYPDLVNDYLNGVSIDDAQHAEMFRSFLGDLANSLKEFGIKRGYNLDSQFYEDLAWSGLAEDKNGTEYSWFTNAFPNQNDRNRIKNTGSIEQNGRDRNGNIKTKKGNDSGC